MSPGFIVALAAIALAAGHLLAYCLTLQLLGA